MMRLRRSQRRGCRTAIHAQNAAEVGDHHVLRDVQSEDAPEGAQPEQPDVQRDAGHQGEHRGQADLMEGTFHEFHYGRGTRGPGRR